MKSKRKLLITFLAIAFALISVVAVIAIVFAATTQTVRTRLNITYTAIDVNAKVSATMQIGSNQAQDMTTTGKSDGATSIEFTADSEEGNYALMPVLDDEEVINLSMEDKYVILSYTFENTGSKEFVAYFDYADLVDANMLKTYSTSGDAYKAQQGAILVPGFETKTYYIKMSIDDVRRSASLTGSINWTLNSDIVVATPTNVNDVLKNDINDRTVVFDGEFTEIISIKPSRESESQVLDTHSNHTNYDNIVSSYPTYQRTLANISFVATDGSMFTDAFVINGQSYSDITLNPDPISNKTSGYITSFVISNVEFKFFNFESKSKSDSNYKREAQIHLFFNEQTGTVAGITIDSCSFTSSNTSFTSDGQYSTAIYCLSYGDAGEFSGLEVTNCNFDGSYLGMNTYNVSDITFSDNIVKNVRNQGISLQQGAAYITGDVVVENNLFLRDEYFNSEYGAGDRAIRMNGAQGATIVVANNTIVNYFNSADNEYDVLKASSLTNGTTFTASNNIYKKSDKGVSYKLTEYAESTTSTMVLNVAEYYE